MRVVCLLAVGLVCLFGIHPTGHSQTLTVEIANYSGVPSDEVYLLINAGSSADGQLTAGVPKLLSDLAGGKFTMSAGSPIGRIFVSFGSPVSVGEPFNSSTRFDWVELTYVGPPPNVSQANLTAVDQFGIPMAIEALGAGGNLLGSKGWAVPGTQIIQTLTALAPSAAVNAPDGTFVRVLAPNQMPSAYMNLQPYVNSLNGQTVTLTGSFVGVNPPIDFAYSGTFQPDGTITLSGTQTQGANPVPAPASVTVSGPAPANPPPTIPALTFAEQIYPANGPYFRSDTGTTFHTAGENNIYSVIYRDLMSGMNNGYIGGKFGNLSTGWAGQPAFAAARTSPDGFFNAYASAVEQLSAATIYGYAFTDATSDPLLDISGAASLKISIYSDSGAVRSKPRLGPPRTLKARPRGKGDRWVLRGRVSDPEGIGSVVVRTLQGRESRNVGAKVRGTRWTARVRLLKQRATHRIRVAAVDLVGDRAVRRYRIRDRR